MKKRGSLNLSIETIVVVVIAFVVLGLGLGFVRTQIKDISSTSTSVQEQIRAQILEDLRTGDRKLSFPATTLSIEKGETQDIAIGVKNTKNSDLNFKIEVQAIEQQGNDARVPEEVAGEVKFFYDKSSFNLKTTDAEAYNIKISADGDKDTYLVNLKIVETDESGNSLEGPPYAEKTFFVEII